MSEPRFRLVRGCTQNGHSAPAWPTAQDPFAVQHRADGCWCSWRLLGANNRELGRGAEVYSSDRECVEAIAAAHAQVASATALTQRVEGLWTWHLEVDGEPFAVAGRSYHRQRECHYSFGQFLLAMVSIPAPAPGDLVLPDRDANSCLSPQSPACGRLTADESSARVLPRGRAQRPPAALRTRVAG